MDIQGDESKNKGIGDALEPGAFRDLEPEEDLWFPPEAVPQEIADLMPGEADLETIREAMFDDLDISLNVIRGMVNIRRREFTRNGCRVTMPNIQNSCTTEGRKPLEVPGLLIFTSRSYHFHVLRPRWLHAAMLGDEVGEFRR